MNYRINIKNNIFEVVEVTTNYIIKSFTLHKEAKDLMRHLNLGGGFDGFTPRFFLKERPYQ